MRHIMLLAVIAAIATSAFTTVLVNGLIFRADIVRSAQEVGVGSSGVPLTSDADGQIQGDIDCDGDVDAVDGLGVLVDVAALDALGQQEPCTDVGDIIPAGAGPPGPQGEQGPQGEPGPPGLSELESFSVETESNTEAEKFASVLCPSGRKAISGGYTVNGASDVIVDFDAAGAAGGSGWSVGGTKLNASLAPWSLVAQVQCAVVAD